VQLLGRSAEAQFAGDRAEIAQVTQFEVHGISSSQNARVSGNPMSPYLEGILQDPIDIGPKAS
jgi:hypothetical protein